MLIIIIIIMSVKEMKAFGDNKTRYVYQISFVEYVICCEQLQWCCSTCHVEL